VKPVAFKDDLVLYYNPRKYVGRSDKWSRKYSGPFRIAEVLSPNMLLQPVNGRRISVSHVDKLWHVPDGNEAPLFRKELKQSNEVEAEVYEVESDKNSNDDQLALKLQRTARPPKRLISEC